MDFGAAELREGVRFAWNTIPTTRAEAAQNVVPLALLYTPFANMEDPVLRCETKPLLCPDCKWTANPFCRLDTQAAVWECVNCKCRVPLHAQLKEYLNAGYSLPEFEERNAIVEYKIGAAPPIAWLFIVDLCVAPAELVEMKTQLSLALQQIERAHVGLVVVGRHVAVYDILSPFVCETVVPGSVEYTPERLREVLGLKTVGSDSTLPSRFLQPVPSCREKLLRIIARLRPDAFAAPPNARKLRATGQGLAVGAAIVECFGGSGSRVTVMLAGACTSGPGRVINPEFSEHFRTHDDLGKDSGKMAAFQKAQRHYDALAERFAKAGCTVDIFAFALDEFGAAELKAVVERTGGLIVQQEEFTMEVFSKSFAKYFALHNAPDAPINVQLQLRVSPGLFVCGALGPLKLARKNKSIYGEADMVIGESGGDEFFLGSPLPASTLCFFFSHVAAEVKSTQANRCHFQLHSTYATPTGERVARVATFIRPFATDKQQVASGFDQEAAMAVVARMAAQKADALDSSDLVLWLNSVLIRLVRRFATFSKGKPETFRNAPEVLLVPQYMYYFRRSVFVQKFLSSVDEFALTRLSLNREMVSNTLVMIQPTLVAYELDKEEAVPVFCDVDSLRPELMMLIDTYFYVLVWQGKTVHGWVQSGYHEQPDYGNLRTLLDLPTQDAKMILEDRLPVPRFVCCHQGSPNERLIKSRLTPASSGVSGNQQDENYITEDTSLSTFMEYLIKLVVK